MKTIQNKTLKPLRIRLPGGKTLFLGGNKRAQLRDAALDHPAIKKLLEAGQIEVVEGAMAGHGQGSGGLSGKGATRAHGGGQGKQSTGDR